MQTIVRSILTASVKRMDIRNRTITFVGTKESPDRTGDIIRVAGWEFENFQKNPVFLWNHDPDVLPPGRVEKIMVVGLDVLFDVRFATASINQFAEAVFRSFEHGFLSAVSVGFIPKDIEPIFMDGQLIGLDILRSELLELSAVAIPAHQDALAASVYGKKMFELETAMDKKQSGKATVLTMTLEEYRKSLPPFTEEVDEAMTPEMKQEFEDLKTKVASLEEGLASVITLRESVDLSAKAMETLNKSIVGLLSKELPQAPTVDTAAELVGLKPGTTLNLDKLMSALGTALGKIEASKTFTTKGE